VTVPTQTRQIAASEKPNDIKPNVTVSRPTGHAAEVTAYVAAIALAGAAAWLSIRGMTVLFPGAPMAVIVMSATHHGGGQAGDRGMARPPVGRDGLDMASRPGDPGGRLAAINAAGVYAQLVAAHVGDRGAATSAIGTQDATLAARIDVQAYNVAGLDRPLSQIDVAIKGSRQAGPHPVGH
jgi:hypothetical protein